MKYLVTGAAGFIGAATCQKLLAAGHKVLGIDNLNDYYDVNLKLARLAQFENHEGFTFIKLDISERSAMSELFKVQQFDKVIHLAAQAGVRYSIENPDAYAVDPPVSFYAATKKANELMAHSYSHLYSLPTTGLRFFTVYGPWGRPDMAPYIFTKKILAGEIIDINNNGDMWRDFTYIDDIVEGVVRAADVVPVPKADWKVETGSPATSSAPYTVYNIGHGSPINLMKFIEAIEAELGIEANKNFREMQAGDVYKTYADTQDLFEATGYKADVGVKKGVSELIKWYKSFYS